MLSDTLLLLNGVQTVQYGPGGHGRGYMDGWGHMSPFGAVGLILLIVIIGVLIYIAVRKREGSPAQESLLDILKRRYARGEITKEEFDRMKREILEE
ncbi:MAG: SHOCT domain-containing protein [Desulfovibrionales bacterium]